MVYGATTDRTCSAEFFSCRGGWKGQRLGSERRVWVEGHGRGTENIREGKGGHGREGLRFLCKDGRWNSSSHSRCICGGRSFGYVVVFGWRRWRRWGTR